MRTIFALLGIVAGAAPALADSPADPPGRAGEPTVLHLSQSADRKLTRDMLHVELRAEKTGADPQTVEAAINQSMAAALPQARQTPGVDIETGPYSVDRETPPNASPKTQTTRPQATLASPASLESGPWAAASSQTPTPIWIHTADAPACIGW